MKNQYGVTQENFRQLVYALSYPGELGQLKLDEAQNVQLDETVSLYSYAACEVLLDGEVTFLSVPENNRLNQELVIFTNVRIASAVESSSVIWTTQSYLNQFTEYTEVFANISLGSHQDPEKSASLFIQVDSLSELMAEESVAVVATGPGIYKNKQLLLPLSRQWIDWRQTVNADYPLGIDVFIVDKQGACLALPRTTVLTVSQEEA